MKNKDVSEGLVYLSTNSWNKRMNMSAHNTLCIIAYLSSDNEDLKSLPIFSYSVFCRAVNVKTILQI